MRDNLNTLRNPYMSASELVAFSSSHVGGYQAHVRGYQARWDKVNRTKEELNTILITAEAIWGKEIKQLFIENSNHAMEIYHELEDHLNAINPSFKGHTKEKNHFAIGSNKENPFCQNQEKIISKIEAFLKPKLKS